MSSCPVPGCNMNTCTENWVVVPGPPILAKGSVSLIERCGGKLFFGLLCSVHEMGHTRCSLTPSKHSVLATEVLNSLPRGTETLTHNTEILS